MSWAIGAYQPGGWSIGAAQSDAVYVFVAHVFDFATHLPADFALIPDMGWFGVGPPEGPDPSYNAVYQGYGLWNRPGAAWNAADPANYPHAPYATQDAATCEHYYGDTARRIGSYYRPQTGIYSSAGRDAESVAKCDLDLGAIRAGSDPRARLTAWAVEVGQVQGTELGGTTPGGTGWDPLADLKVKCLQTKLARAVALGVGPRVTFEYTADQVPQYGGYQTEAEEIEAITQDLVAYVNILKASAGALRVKSGAYTSGGRLVISLWHGGLAMYTTAQWHALLEDVRSQTNEDVYTVFRYNNYSGSQSQYDHADGAFPWSGNSYWDTATGATTRLRAADWTAQRLAPLKTEAAAAGADRVVLGSVFPGFVDWGKQAGAGNERLIERSEELMQGQIDQLLTDGVTAVQAGTWNDWGEGTQYEPALEVPSGAASPPYPEPAGDALRWLTEGLGRLHAETIDPLKTASLLALWSSYGVARGCPAYLDLPETGHDAHGIARQSGVLATIQPSGALGVAAKRGAIL